MDIGKMRTADQIPIFASVLFVVKKPISAVEGAAISSAPTAERKWTEVIAMSVEQMRVWLKKQYGGSWKWVNKVNAMHDEQVIAVYHRMLYAHQLK